MRKLFLAFALIAATLFVGLVIERDSAAQNSNKSTTMSNMGNMGSKPGMTGRRRHRRRRHRRRRHRRTTMGNKNMNSTGNKNKNMKM